MTENDCTCGTYCEHIPTLRSPENDALAAKVLALLDDTEWEGIDPANGGFSAWRGRRLLAQRLTRLIRRESVVPPDKGEG